jgi:excinuclease ABC subunit A
MSDIQILGAEEHNLKSVNVHIPKCALVAFTGVSGSGKSSLIFDTLYAESYRRFSDASQVPVHLMGRQSAVSGRRPRFHAIRGLPPALGLSQRQGVAGKLSSVGTVSGVADLLRVYFAAFGEVSCRKCDIPLRSMTFADVMAALKQRFLDKRISVFAPIAEKRKGAFADEIERFRKFGFTRMRINGKIIKLDADTDDLRLDARKLNTLELLVDAFQLRAERMERAERAVSQAVDIAKIVRVEVDGDGDSQAMGEVFNLASACPQCGESAPRLDPRYFSNTSIGKCLVCEGSGEALDGMPADLFPCGSCGGSRLNPLMPIVRVRGKTFPEVSRMRLDEVMKLCLAERTPEVANSAARTKVIDEILRLTAVQVELGVGHLTIGRSGQSLAPGDLQRLRLASLLANRLRGAVYVLDEPCQGLTQDEVGALAKLLKGFVDSGCSVVAVEHHPDFLRAADHVFVMGPGAGAHGGKIVQVTTGRDYGSEANRARANKDKLAARSVGAPGSVPLRFPPAVVRGVSFGEIKIYPNSINLLRGPSGAGKSTFINLCLAPLLARHCEALDEDLLPLRDIPEGIWASDPSGSSGVAGSKRKRTRSPSSIPQDFVVSGMSIVRPGTLVRSTRRTVASALDILVPLRMRFETLVSSQVLGLVAADFSWSSKKGKCSECSGRGFLEYEQKYAPPIEVVCPSCNGAKLGRQSLLPRLRGKNFAEVLDLTVEQALDFFANDRQIRLRLESAHEFGLGYVRLNQTMESLSGGEMQRLVLTIDLKRVRVEGYWYLLTHPGTGLHLPDINILGELIGRLVARGATFVLTENREEFSKFADHTIIF